MEQIKRNKHSKSIRKLKNEGKEENIKEKHKDKHKHKHKNIIMQKEKEEELKKVGSEEIDASKEKVHKIKEEISGTISIVIPSSIIANAQTPELKAYLVSQIARAASIFKIFEIIVINDYRSSSSTASNPTEFLIRNLQYLETPQYLRKTLFPMCPDLKFVGIMNPIESPHHLKKDEFSPYREGVVVQRPTKKGEVGSWVNIGLGKDCYIPQAIRPGTRLTVALNDQQLDIPAKCAAVSSSTPSRESGMYWGYRVRSADSLLSTFSSPWESPYDLLIGTSDKGMNYKNSVSESPFPPFKHCLIFLGGLTGIEGIVEGDESSGVSVGDTSTMFHYWLNTCLGQGCRTIRTEEALLITLSVLIPYLRPE